MYFKQQLALLDGSAFHLEANQQNTKARHLEWSYLAEGVSSTFHGAVCVYCCLSVDQSWHEPDNCVPISVGFAWQK